MSPAKMASKFALEASYQLQSYYGYSFESYCTSPLPSSSTTPGATFDVPNTNEQWCSIVKTSLGNLRVIIGGEVDCIAQDSARATRSKQVTTEDFIELKTNIVIENARDEMMFEK
jgi:RAT1-interacting protein